MPVSSLEDGMSALTCLQDFFLIVFCQTWHQVIYDILLVSEFPCM